MGFLDKLKDIFYEEEELEPKKKKEEETMKEEVKEEKREESKIDPAFVISERELFKTDPKFKFPVNFEEEDLIDETTNRVNALEEEENKYRVVETTTVVEEKRVFRPSPVISPVYGILDKNYKKSDIIEKGSASGFDINAKLDVDSVMKRAYGEVEVQKTITREEKFYSNLDKDLHKEEPKEEKETEINLFEKLKEEPKKDDYEEESYDLSEIDDKIKSIDALLKETSDDDFYALVDNMYKDEEGE